MSGIKQTGFFVRGRLGGKGNVSFLKVRSIVKFLFEIVILEEGLSLIVVFVFILLLLMLFIELELLKGILVLFIIL